MKNKILSILSIAMIAMLVLTISGTLSNQDVSVADTTSASDLRTVTVTGEGEVIVTPDLAYVTIGVETKDADAKVAQSTNAALMDKVIKAIKAKGIKDDQIKTSGYNLYQTYDYNGSDVKDQTAYYYVASNTLEVKVTDIDLVGSIIDTATGAGANNINRVRFTVADDSTYYQEALKLAMNNANGKATAIMSTFGKKPALPSSVSETSYGGGLYYDYTPAKAMMEAADSVATPIESGDITITANVSVSYDY